MMVEVKIQYVNVIVLFAYTLTYPLVLPYLSHVMHQFVASWQDRQFKLCTKSVQKGHILSCVRFIENYTFKQQQQIS